MPADSDHLVANRAPEPSTQREGSVSERIAASSLNAYTWVEGNPAAALLLLTVIGTLVYFFGFVPLFVKGLFASGVGSTAVWAWQAWTGTQEHSRLVPFISLGLVWYHRKKIKKAEKYGSNRGLVFVGTGIALFLLSARCLQPRFALVSVPFLIYGSVLYLWGKQVARIVLFPCAFLIFMVPVAAIEQGTFQLQFIITGIVGFLSNLVGLKIQALGTTLTAADNSFNFAIAEGCSGIRSLFAMTMLTAIYVHLTQREMWRKIVILAFSLVFAIAGNIGRIFTVILVAKFISPTLAAGIYHEYSGFVFFPIALLAMLLFSKLINLNRSQTKIIPHHLQRDPLRHDY
jgi:exosortase